MGRNGTHTESNMNIAGGGRIGTGAADCQACGQV
jgi:hypothetical protein